VDTVPLPKYQPGPVKIFNSFFFVGSGPLYIGLGSGPGHMTRENQSEYGPAYKGNKLQF